MRNISEKPDVLSDEYNVPVFSCDSGLYITQVNKFILNNNFNIKVGQQLNEIFSIESNEYLSTFEKLIKGLPFMSTNFEYNMLKTTICMLPLMENEKVESIFCILNFDDLTSALHSYRGSSSPLISERFRSPVAGIMNVSAILARRFQTDEDYKALDYLNHITRCCYRMLNTSVSIQEYYALVNGKQQFKMKKSVFNIFLENICRTLQILFVNSDYRLEFINNSTESIITEFDEEKLSLAIFNIIANSCHFSAKGSTIRVYLSNGNNTVSVTIADEGSGIDNAIIDRVYDPFFSVHPYSVSEEEMGIGLGLPIVKKIVDAHDGQIFITSEINRGTTIVISLPIKSDADMPLTLNSDAAKYVTDKFSNMYLIFAEICNITLY